MPSISLCMITKDEEKWLDQSLSSVKDLVDEIIIVDTGSKDDTKKIAKKFKAKVFDFKWCDDFSAARNESLKHATKDWILVLDADETLDDDGKNKIKKLIKTKKQAFTLDQRSYVKVKQRKARPNDSEEFSEYPFYVSNKVVRLFRNNLGLEFKNRVHELIEHSLEENGIEKEESEITIHHFGSVKDTEFVLNKAKKYSNLILKQLADDPNNHRYNYQAGQMYLEAGDPNKALAHFIKCAQVRPSYKLVFSEIAKIYIKAGKMDKAIEFFSKSMHYTDNPSPANNLAVLYLKMGRLSMAKILLEAQLKKHPDNPALKHNYEKLKAMM